MLTTTVVGSYPQPRWRLDHEILKSHAVPRIRMPEMWRIAEPYLEDAQDDAVRLAVRDMEEAGIDIVTDGEQRRESYFRAILTSTRVPERPKILRRTPWGSSTAGVRSRWRAPSVSARAPHMRILVSSTPPRDRGTEAAR